MHREYLLWAVNVLTNSVVISDQTNADFFQLNVYPKCMEKYTHNSGAFFADFSVVWNPLTRWLPHGLLKHDLLEV